MGLDTGSDGAAGALTALAAGAVFAVAGAGFLLTSTLSGSLHRRLGRLALPAGAVVVAAGLGLLGAAVALPPWPAPVWSLLPGLAVDGAGLGLIMAPLISRVTATTRRPITRSVTRLGHRHRGPSQYG